MFLNRTRSRGSKEKEELSFLCVPVKINNKTIGALSVDRTHKEQIGRASCRERV